MYTTSFGRGYLPHTDFSLVCFLLFFPLVSFCSDRTFTELIFCGIVCDVGQGKEASDAKIREYLKLYASNAQCRSIILGASHDNGYANILSS